MNSNLEWRHMKKRKPVYPIEVKKAAIEDLENGKKTAKEIMEEFNIQRDTIRGWKRQVEYYKNGMFHKKRYSKVIRMKAAREVLMGFLTVRQAMVKYEIRSKTSIKNWINEYTYGSKISTDISSNSTTGMQEEKIEENYLDKRHLKATEALEKAQLKILALETMIDVAEKELGIRIRKKFGTKQ